MEEATNKAFANAPDRIKMDGYQIVEDGERLLTLAVSGSSMKEGKRVNLRGFESFGLINGRVLRLAATSITELGDTPKDMSPQLNEWWQAILSANNAY